MSRSSFGILTLSVCVLSPLGIAMALAIEEPKAPPLPKGFDPKFEIRIVPVQPPKGEPEYPKGTTIVGQELQFPEGVEGSQAIYFEALIAPEVRPRAKSLEATMKAENPPAKLLGHCCRPIDELGRMSQCEDVFSTEAQNACEDSFVPGVKCQSVFCPSSVRVSYARIPARVVPVTVCSPIAIVSIEGPYSVEPLHPNGTHRAIIDATGILFESTAMGNGDVGSSISGSFGRGRITLPSDCQVINVVPDEIRTVVKNQFGRAMDVRTIGMKVVFHPPMDAADK